MFAEQNHNNWNYKGKIERISSLKVEIEPKVWWLRWLLVRVDITSIG